MQYCSIIKPFTKPIGLRTEPAYWLEVPCVAGYGFQHQRSELSSLHVLLVPEGSEKHTRLAVWIQGGADLGDGGATNISAGQP
mmetsp:Transcript_36022/g.94679  ORF Transcript_36022/g.94679 Transcript_36022/m.94679 type:complete len:83 (+) Transcript_36022:214-462(+)